MHRTEADIPVDNRRAATSHWMQAETKIAALDPALLLKVRSIGRRWRDWPSSRLVTHARM
jgi:hypothetical protein